MNIHYSSVCDYVFNPRPSNCSLPQVQCLISAVLPSQFYVRARARNLQRWAHALISCCPITMENSCICFSLFQQADSDTTFISLKFLRLCFTKYMSLLSWDARFKKECHTEVQLSQFKVGTRCSLALHDWRQGTSSEIKLCANERATYIPMSEDSSVWT